MRCGAKGPIPRTGALPIGSRLLGLARLVLRVRDARLDDQPAAPQHKTIKSLRVGAGWRQRVASAPLATSKSGHASRRFTATQPHSHPVTQPHATWHGDGILRVGGGRAGAGGEWDSTCQKKEHDATHVIRSDAGMTPATGPGQAANRQSTCAHNHCWSSAIVHARGFAWVDLARWVLGDRPTTSLPGLPAMFERHVAHVAPPQYAAALLRAGGCRCSVFSNHRSRGLTKRDDVRWAPDTAESLWGWVVFGHTGSTRQTAAARRCTSVSW